LAPAPRTLASSQTYCSTSMVSRPFRPHLRIISQTQAVGLGSGITAPWAGAAPTSARVTNLRDDGGETLFSRAVRAPLLRHPGRRHLGHTGPTTPATLRHRNYGGEGLARTPCQRAGTTAKSAAKWWHAWGRTISRLQSTRIACWVVHGWRVLSSRHFGCIEVSQGFSGQLELIRVSLHSTLLSVGRARF